MEDRHGQAGRPHLELKRGIEAMLCGTIIGINQGIIIDILYHVTIILYIHSEL
jgi:hypothetical protein